MLSPLILQCFGWRALFYLFGVLGVPLLALWAAVVPARVRAVGSVGLSVSQCAGGYAWGDIGVGRAVVVVGVV